MTQIRADEGLIAVLLCAGVFAWAGSVSFAEAPPTFAEDVAPIFYAHCVECHRPGTAAPMSLLEYREARPWAKSIAKKVAAREMPPWFASGDGLTFRNENRLAEAEIATIVRWVESGARPGNPGAMPADPVPEDRGWRLGEPDAIVSMREPYSLADGDTDVLTRIVLDSGLAEDRWVRAIEVRPGKPSVVHHVVVIAGAAGFGKHARRGRTQMLSVYAVGSPPAVYPEGLGKRLSAGSAITLSMHYHKEAGPGTATGDRTQVGLFFADEADVQPITTGWVINRGLDIAPGEADHETRASTTFQDDGHLYAFLPHMHYRGKDFLFRARYPDGTVETLLDVPRYDFNWQLWYYLEEPKAIPKGTVIEAIAHHDNSASNPANPDPSRRVRWGGASTDEMMIGYFDYTYASETGPQTDLAHGVK